MKMEYNVQILRGWPYDGAMDRAETVKSGSTLSNGDWVAKQSDGTVDKVGATKTAAAGLVVRGNGDSTSTLVSISAASGSGSSGISGFKKCTVLWGGFIAQIKNLPNSVTFTAGAAVCIQNGMIQLATGTDPIIGYVLDVNTGTATTDTFVTVKVA